MDEGSVSILMVCDFFYPRLGGVEVSIYQLSCALMRKGFRVTIITHHYKNRKGIKYMGNGIKVRKLLKLTLGILPTLMLTGRRHNCAYHFWPPAHNSPNYK